MFSPQTEAKIDALIAKYPYKRSAILPIIHLAQLEQGKVTEEAIHYIADRLDLEPVEVYEVVTFYSMYFMEEIGKYHLQVCRTLSCMLCGAEEITAHLEKKLGIKPGQVTPDGRFRLSEVECLGSCATAPVMQVNFDYYENLTPEKVDEILKNLP
ncbi:MAG: NADH-quinone oxidoreductase subunit NuoE [Acidobacteriota bacterium]|nr:NADH-quinone oxidoreductase subunit NuoE [Blastocatellia bacterium]MDW8412766.1 NADH-quinone oxidoreductase subunit NuoE [Acidobacteriota bacterium]